MTGPSLENHQQSLPVETINFHFCVLSSAGEMEFSFGKMDPMGNRIVRQVKNPLSYGVLMSGKGCGTTTRTKVKHITI